jgi:8-oxo-dGTP pyrophosphatase MutT (NUDIX family)
MAMPPAAPPSIELVVSALRERLPRRVPARLRIPAQLLRSAAVLVPLQVRAGDLWVVLTERRKDLRSHAGQISFPGGSIDAGDASPAAAALREADEELGIRPADVEVLGPLDEYPTVTRFKIIPFVGLLPFPYPFAASASEVARVIEAPFSAFLAPGAYRQDPAPVPVLGRLAMVSSYQVGEHRVWGATAAIFKQLLELAVAWGYRPPGREVSAPVGDAASAH